MTRRPAHVPRALWWHTPRGRRRKLSGLIGVERDYDDKFDLHGRPITLAAWAFLLEQKSYARVAETTVGPQWISTIWLRLDHLYGFGDGGIRIFETMVFTGGESVAQYRYATLKEARRGHAPGGGRGEADPELKPAFHVEHR